MTDSKRRRGLVAASALLGGVLVLSACCGGGDSSAAERRRQATRRRRRSTRRRPRTPPRPRSRSRRRTARPTPASTTPQGHRQQGHAHRGDDDRPPTARPSRATISADEHELEARAASWSAPPRTRSRATAKDSEGREAHENASFTTVSPANSFIGNFTPEDGSTVGVGMPVSINFDKAITNKKAVQSGITVTSSSGQQVVGHWFNANRLDCRPEEYWKAGSTVTLKLALDGVEGADGVYGVQQKTVTFKIGRNQVSHGRRQDQAR